MNVLSPNVAILALLWGLWCGVSCASEALQSDSIASGFCHVFRLMRKFDVFSTEIILAEYHRGEISCIPKPPPSPSEAVDGSPERRVDSANDTLEKVYSSFLKHCRAIAWTTVENGEIKQEHMVDTEPFIILGVPAAALFDMLVADKSNMSNDSTIQCADMKIKRSSLGQSNGIVQVFWPKIMVIRKKIATHELSAADISYVRFHLIAGGAPQEEMTDQAREMKKAMDDDNIDTAKLNGIVSDLTSFLLD